MRVQVTSCERYRLRVTTWGSGAPPHAVVLPGLSADWRALAPQIRTLRRLGWSVHVIDLPGFALQPSLRFIDSAWPIDSDKRFDPIDVLDYAIEELGHTQSELAELLGSRSRASEILARRRALTVDMIHKLSEAWKIPADLLVRPYRVDSAA